MATNVVSDYLKYANLQMAAEAFLNDQEEFGKRLTTGNNRSSRFTDVLADQFINDGWKVVEQKDNTFTGFSGTLFKNTQTGELVMSFRSTEFLDDAACDNAATNTLEIRPFGWAFGQISDMKDWYDSLLSTGKLSSTDKFAVTGYSLGGHLAGASNFLNLGAMNLFKTLTVKLAAENTIFVSVTQAHACNVCLNRLEAGNNADWRQAA